MFADIRHDFFSLSSCIGMTGDKYLFVQCREDVRSCYCFKMLSKPTIRAPFFRVFFFVFLSEEHSLKKRKTLDRKRNRE